MSAPRISSALLVALVAFCVLALEILSIRIAHVSFGSNFQFFIIPLSLLGLGLGASLSVRVQLERTESFLLALVAFACVAPIQFFTHYLEGVFHPYVTMSLFFAASFVMHTVAGWILSSFFAASYARLPLIYFFDLLGAGMGAITAILAMNIFGYSISVFLVLCISLVPAALLHLTRYGYTRTILLFGSAAGLYAALLLSNAFILSCVPDPEPVITKSNSFSFVEAVPMDLSLNQELGTVSPPSPQDYSTYGLTIDCRVSKTMLVTSSSYENLSFLRQSLRSIPFAFLEMQHGSIDSVLIPSAGAGIDITRAQLFNVGTIDATEFNPLIVELTHQLSTPLTDPYLQENVVLHPVNTLVFLASVHPEKQYDLIANYLTGRFGTISGDAETPNYGATTEVAGRLFSKLDRDGILAFSGPARENGVSVIGFLAGALQSHGLAPEERIVYISGEREDLGIARATPFTKDEQELLARLASERGFSALTYSSATPHLSADPSQLTFDKPYAYFSPRDVKTFSPERLQALLQHTLLGIALLGICSLAVFWRFAGNPSPRARTAIAATAYFAALGVGFIVFELWALQKFFLLIADPAYTTAISLACILFFGGLGSLAARLFPSAKTPYVLALSTLVLLVYFFFSHSYLDPSIEFLTAYSFAVRALVAAALLALPAFIFGLFISIGLVAVSKVSKEAVMISFAIDGMFGVAGGFLAKSLFHIYGLHTAHFITMACYAIALVSFFGLYRSTGEEGAPQ